MFEGEVWHEIEELPHYHISSHGRVKHVERNEVRKLSVNEKGFPVVLLSSKTSATRYLRQVNKLVAQAFLPPPQFSNETAVWHIDGNLLNCRADNLRWEMRARVLEWNEMHRNLTPRFTTPRVKNNRTGIVYENAFECGMAEGMLESAIVWRVERQARHMEDDSARYRYVFD
jgi:hypothetical protein